MNLRSLETPQLAECLMRRRAVAEPPPRWLSIVALAAWAVGLLGLLRWNSPLIFLVGFGVQVVLVLILLRHTLAMWRLGRARREVERRLDNVPYDVRRSAEALYADDEWPWECWAIECCEAHMPGDCPLCGAD